MKKLALIAVTALAITSSCGTKEKLEQAEEQNTVLNSQLQATLATQDSLFALINDITDGMSQIKDLEQIVSTPGALDGESSSRKEQLKNDMVAIREALQQRRQRLDELEKQLKQTSGKNSTLIKTIDNLKAQIAEQETEISTLNNKLADANIRITALGAQVDSLSTTVVVEQKGREEAEQEAVNLTNELNTCYFAIGTKGELKDRNIIETGFLRKTKIMEGDFDSSYFTRADKRTLTTVPLHSKKAQILTKQPKDSYEIIDEGGQKVLRITNPAKFWSISNFLVVQVD